MLPNGFCCISITLLRQAWQQAVLNEHASYLHEDFFFFVCCCLLSKILTSDFVVGWSWCNQKRNSWGKNVYDIVCGQTSILYERKSVVACTHTLQTDYRCHNLWIFELYQNSIKLLRHRLIELQPLKNYTT